MYPLRRGRMAEPYDTTNIPIFDFQVADNNGSRICRSVCSVGVAKFSMLLDEIVRLFVYGMVSVALVRH